LGRLLSTRCASDSRAGPKVKSKLTILSSATGGRRNGEQGIIEILVKLRDEAQAGLAKLTGGLGDVARKNDDASGSTDRLSRSQSALQVSSVALGTVIGDMTTRIGCGLVDAFQSTIQQASQFDTAMAGLDAVARAMGISVTDARAAAQSRP
jgi:hypothetical protein